MKSYKPALKIQVCALFCLTALPIAVRAQTTENRNAKYYDVGKLTEPPLFTQHIVVETATPGERTWNSEIKDASGTVIITETAVIKLNSVVSQVINNAQSQEACELQVGPEKVIYRTYHFVDGKRGELIEEKTRDKEESFITGPAVEFYLDQRWEQLNSGEPVVVQFGIFEIMRSIGFALKKEGETAELLKVEMRPTNFFIRLLVDPLHLVFDKSTKRLVHYTGRTPLRRMHDGKLKPWDAEIVYEPMAN